MITVINNSSIVIHVAINSWGRGSSDYFTIHPGQQEQWDRTDDRAFIMDIKESQRLNGTYIVWQNSVAEFTDDRFGENTKNVIRLRDPNPED